MWVQHGLDVLAQVGNEHVTTNYIKWVKSHYAKHPQPSSLGIVDEHTIVDHFCYVVSALILINVPAVQNPLTDGITVKKIATLADEMNTAATTGNWGTSQREWMIDQIATMTGNQKITKLLKGKQARSFLTPEGQALAAVTMDNSNKSGNPYFGKNYKDIKAMPKVFPTTSISGDYTLLEDSIKKKQLDKIDVTLQEQLDHSKNKIPSITGIERKVCAKCWMCGFDIYVYKITDTNGNVSYIPCGEDEHVLPPGWANVIGILWSNKTDHLKYNVNTNCSLLPSHILCNQGKNAELLVKVPSTSTNFQFACNQAGMNRYFHKGLTWLRKGTNASLGHDMVPHRLYTSDPLSEVLMRHVRKTMTDHITKLITDVNRTPVNAPKTNILYDIFMLRTVLCIAYIYIKLTELKSYTGGNGNIGGPDGYTFNKINFKTDLLASCIYATDTLPNYIYLYGTNKRIALRSIKASCRRFQSIENEILCSFNDYYKAHKDTQPEPQPEPPPEPLQRWSDIKKDLINNDNQNKSKIITNTLPYGIAILVTSYLGRDPPLVIDVELELEEPVPEEEDVEHPPVIDVELEEPVPEEEDVEEYEGVD